MEYGRMLLLLLTYYYVRFAVFMLSYSVSGADEDSEATRSELHELSVWRTSPCQSNLKQRHPTESYAPSKSLSLHVAISKCPTVVAEIFSSFKSTFTFCRHTVGAQYDAARVPPRNIKQIINHLTADK